VRWTERGQGAVVRHEEAASLRRQEVGALDGARTGGGGAPRGDGQRSMGAAFTQRCCLLANCQGLTAPVIWGSHADPLALHPARWTRRYD
jgi:hypothetical protein